MRTPNESKSSPTTPSQDIQPPVPSHPPHVSQAPVVASAAAMTAATSQTNNQTLPCSMNDLFCDSTYVIDLHNALNLSK